MIEITTVNRRNQARQEFNNLMHTICMAIEHIDGADINKVRALAYEMYKGHIELIDTLEQYEQRESSRQIRRLDAPSFMYRNGSR